jgi:hypothetical protein
MGLSLDYINLIVISDASITDAVAFHALLRDIESSSIGMLYPVVHTYKAVQLGGGAIFPALAFINGWTLQFVAGSFELSGGNYDVTINPVPNCYVKNTQAGAYAVTAVGGTGLSPTDVNSVANAVWSYSR